MNKHRSAGRRRRKTCDAKASIRPHHRLTPLRLVVHEIREGQQPAALLNFRDHRLPHNAVLKNTDSSSREQIKRLREIRLNNRLPAHMGCIKRPELNPPCLREDCFGKTRPHEARHARVIATDHKAISRELNGRCQNLRKRHRPMRFEQSDHPRHKRRRRYGQRPHDRSPLRHPRIRVHRRCRPSRRRLPRIERPNRPVLEPHQRKRATADPRREGLRDTDRERRRDRCVNGVATLVQNPRARFGRRIMGRNDHPALPANRWLRRGLHQTRGQKQKPGGEQ